MKLSVLLAETDRKELAPWPEGIHFENSFLAELPEPGAPPPNPASYFAPTTPTGPITTRGAHTGVSRRNPVQSADDWILNKYLHSRWNKIHKGSRR